MLYLSESLGNSSSTNSQLSTDLSTCLPQGHNYIQEIENCKVDIASN